MKKIVTLAVAAAMLLVSACAANTGSVDTLEGTSSEVMAEINSGANAGEIATFDEALTSENCAATIGLSADSFSSCVEEGTLSSAMISSIAHMTAVIKCKDAAAAATVRDEIASNFDMTRWVCVIPDEAFAVDSGSYVFFVASLSDNATALYDSFTSLAGDTVGERVEIS